MFGGFSRHFFRYVNMSKNEKSFAPKELCSKTTLKELCSKTSLKIKSALRLKRLRIFFKHIVLLTQF